MKVPGQPYTVYKRGKYYYARFKLPNGKWSTAQTTKETKKSAAIKWCVEQLKDVHFAREKTEEYAKRIMVLSPQDRNLLIEHLRGILMILEKTDNESVEKT